MSFKESIGGLFSKRKAEEPPEGEIVDYFPAEELDYIDEGDDNG